jgi:hypothetical protein
VLISKSFLTSITRNAEPRPSTRAAMNC